ncbi:MAG TPA: 5-bromo-4-chloroindolyl phosphate hydrolysis family protein [Thermohalobaculum sp.]|nr:5-bromo-4-chloroindolyl phosphate hydrolysis family protein [Thermohalobaculum sp.]
MTAGADDTAGRVAEAANPFRGRAAMRVDLRGLLLFVLPVPLFFAALGDLGAGAGLAALADLAAFCLLELGAFSLREGQRAEAAYRARAVASPPAVPRKALAATLAGAGVALAAATGWGLDLAASAVMGAIAGGSHLLAFGLDPMRAKGIDVNGPEAKRVAGALARAYEKTAEIEALAHRLRDRGIARKVDAMLAAVRSILGRIEADPRDLPRARRYLSVYLTGAHEATRKYVEHQAETRDPTLRTDYLALLDELERSFARGRETLLLEDRSELEVEIEVLRERLARDT